MNRTVELLNRSGRAIALMAAPSFIGSLTLLAGCASGDDPGEPTYDVTLDTFAADLSLDVTMNGRPEDGAPERVIVRLERFYGSAGLEYEHCPTVPGVRATINGAPMEADPGGEWSLDTCQYPSFAIDVDQIPNALDAPETTIVVTDGSSTMRLVTTNLFVTPTVTWKAPAGGRIREGDIVTLGVTPSGRALLSRDITYLPDASAASGQGDQLAVSIDGWSVEASDDGISFPLPALPIGMGVIAIESMGTEAIFGAAQKECSGVGGCAVHRSACVDQTCDAVRIPPTSLEDDIFLPVEVVE